MVYMIAIVSYSDVHLGYKPSAYVSVHNSHGNLVIHAGVFVVAQACGSECGITC